MFEWRIFVPNFSDHNDPEIRYAFNQLYLLLEQQFHAKEEVREDNYLVTDDSFGLKYRSGEKLELKKRLSSLQWNIEFWEKYKLKKKKIKKQSEAILEILNNPPLNDLYLTYIKKKHSINIRKSRIKSSSDFKSDVEFCKIEILDDHNHKDSDDEDDEEDENNKHKSTIITTKWISLSIESSDANHLKNSLQSDALFHNFFGLLYLLLARIPSTHSTQPIVGGYPMFVSYLGGSLPTVVLSENMNVLQQMIGIHVN